MILTVTPNAAVDKTYRIEGFSLDRVNRPSAVFTVAGGKGVNVARVYQTLGGTAVATGFLGGVNGRIVARALRTERISEEFVRVRGESRMCTAIIDPLTGTQTEINEQGTTVTVGSVRKLIDCVARLVRERSFTFAVFSGSLPPGAPDTLYAELIGIANRAGVRSVLDTSGNALREGVKAEPWMVKPNKFELEGLLNRSIQGLADTGEAVEALHRTGVSIAVATLGADGALARGADDSWYAEPPAIDFASAVASGDSFLAAFLWSWEYGPRPENVADALQLAVGAGAANASVIGAGFCTRASIHELAAKTVIRSVSRSLGSAMAS